MEEHYAEVYSNYHRIICAKSENALFTTKYTTAVHKLTLKDMHWNCVSDIPFVCYYGPIAQE